jgi:Transcriptional regulators
MPVVKPARSEKDQDSFRKRVDTLGHALSPLSRRVVQFIDQNPAAALASSAAELATNTGTSDATVIRTVQALGYSGLGDLKQSLVASVELSSTPVDQMRRTLKNAGRSTARAVDAVFEAHEEALELLRLPDSRTQIVAAVSVLHPAERVVVFGIGPSAFVAGYVSMLLGRSGKRSTTLDATGIMLADQLLDLRVGDALLILAYGRAYHEVLVVFEQARRLALPIVLVTDSLPDKLARFADVLLQARRGRTEQVALHGATLVCLEALILGLAAANRNGAIATLDRLNTLRKACVAR